MSYLLALLYAALLLLRAGLSLRYAAKLPKPRTAPPPPGTLTVAQPILSGDPALESLLEANLNFLPEQQFLWLIDESDTEARRIADKLKRPNLEVRLFPPCPDATNPKLWKLQGAAAFVRTPFICVLDDDTVLTPQSAATLCVAAETATVATGLPCYQDDGGVANGLLAQFVNNNSIFTYLGTASLLSPFTLNGMGYVLGREQLAKLDHFRPILHELTDDLALAALVLKRGGSIHQSVTPLAVRTGVKNLRHYGELMHRWYVFTLLLLKTRPFRVQLLVFFLHGLPSWLLLSLVVLHDPLVLGAVLLLRYVVLRHLHTRFIGRSLRRPFISVLSELLQPAHLLHAACVRTIRWRTRRYHVRTTGDFSEI